VVASLDEATATGNIMVQALALGIVKNVAEIREVTAKSFPSKIYEPEDIEIWDKEFQDYLKIIDMVLK
jgi:rhamnulokinase